MTPDFEQKARELAPQIDEALDCHCGTCKRAREEIAADRAKNPSLLKQAADCIAAYSAKWQYRGQGVPQDVACIICLAIAGSPAAIQHEAHCIVTRLLNADLHEPVAIAQALREMYEAGRAAVTVPARPASASRVLYRHKKRGTVYELIGQAEIQAPADAPLTDYEIVQVYRGIGSNGPDGWGIYVRRLSEFNDGRFEVVNPTQGA